MLNGWTRARFCFCFLVLCERGRENEVMQGSLTWDLWRDCREYVNRVHKLVHGFLGGGGVSSFHQSLERV